MEFRFLRYICAREIFPRDPIEGSQGSHLQKQSSFLNKHCPHLQLLFTVDAFFLWNLKHLDLFILSKVKFHLKLAVILMFLNVTVKMFLFCP